MAVSYKDNGRIETKKELYGNVCMSGENLRLNSVPEHCRGQQ